MLRAVLVGLLAVSAGACKSGGDAAKSQPGVAAGKVVEVSGTVMVRHDNVARPLAKGETVEGDDVVETGADGNVIIELSHNLARWELGANKQSKVRESAAWSLPKKAGTVANVQQDTAAAGRPAERSAAETSVSAESAPAPAAPPAPAAAPAPAAQPAAAVASAPPSAEPPPPPPPAKAAAPAKPAPARGGGDMLDEASGGGGAPAKTLTRGGGASADKAPAPGSGAAEALAVDEVLKHQATIEACMGKDAQAVSLRITIGADGKATAVTVKDVPARVEQCVKKAIAKLTFPKQATTVTLQVQR